MLNAAGIDDMAKFSWAHQVLMDSRGFMAAACTEHQLNTCAWYNGAVLARRL